MPRILIIAAIIVALVFGGKLLYRHFVTNRIVDWSGMVIYEPMGNEDGTFLSRYCHGTWWMENDCLYLDTYNDRGDMVGGLFPVLLSFSGGTTANHAGSGRLRSALLQGGTNHSYT